MNNEDKKKRADEIKKVLKVKEDYENNTLDKIAEALYEKHMQQNNENSNKNER